MEIVSSLTKKAPNLTLSLLDKKIFKKKHCLLLVCSADRGLCGGFNGSIIKFTKKTCRSIKN